MKLMNNLNNLWKRGGAVTIMLLAGGIFTVGEMSKLPKATAVTDVTREDLETVREDTNKLLGETVTISGEVEEKVGLNAFRLEEDELFADDSVLVISVDPALTKAIRENAEVRVTGEVRKMVVADIEKEYDLDLDLDLKQQLETEYEGKPVVVADFTQVY